MELMHVPACGAGVAVAADVAVVKATGAGSRNRDALGGVLYMTGFAYGRYLQ